MQTATVAILRTKPDTVLDDYARLAELAGMRRALDAAAPTILKANISWQRFFPACSTTPWQLEGVIRALIAAGFPAQTLSVCQNRTVVVSARRGEVANKHLSVVNRYGLRNVHLYEREVEWVDVREAAGDAFDGLLALNRVYPDGFRIPRAFIGANIVHLPTVKTHVFTTITGAVKNAFGGLLNERRHWAHEFIHEALVDLLTIQRKVHAGVFAFADGTFAGDGPGPRCMTPHVKGVIIASADSVALDAVCAKLMGFDPMRDVRFIRLAHEMGLGCGETSRIHLAGDAEAAAENWRFEGPYRRMTFAARMQHAIYWGRLRRPLKWSLRTWLAPWSYLASIAYHDWFWYPLVGRRRVKAALKTPWGELFKSY
jgi:uncharacterized protein (DUF362 family)